MNIPTDMLMLDNPTRMDLMDGSLYEKRILDKICMFCEIQMIAYGAEDVPYEI